MKTHIQYFLFPISPPNASRFMAQQILVAAALLLGGLALEPAAKADGGIPLWTNRGTVGGFGASIAVDGMGNVFVTGDATVAYSNAGVSLWTDPYPGLAYNIAVDTIGNVFVSGESFGGYILVAHSGSGISLWTNHLSGGATAIAAAYNGNVFVTGDVILPYPHPTGETAAFSNKGVLLWTNPAVGNAIATDKDGNVFVTGHGYATRAYSGTGIPLWTNIYKGIVRSNDATARAIAVDRTGNVFVTGYSYGVGFQTAYATLAYSGGGIPLWTNLYNSDNYQDVASAIAVDRNGNVFVTGSSSLLSGHSAYVTVAYSGAGVPLWTNRYDVPGTGVNRAGAIAVDNSGNVFVTGYVSEPIYSCVTVAYSGQGLPLWTNRYNEPESLATASGIVVDGDGNVFVTGTAAPRAPLGTRHSFTIKYSSSLPPNIQPVVTCPSAATAECGTPVELMVNVSDPDGDALTVFWTINGQVVQTNSVAASESEVGTNVSFIADLPPGTNVVGVLVSDDATNTASCSTTVTVVDTIPPAILSAAASPSVLWPPSHQMVPVNVEAHVTDDCGPTVWRIVDVRSNEPGDGSGDWEITSDHTLNLRAERSGKGAARIYSVVLQARDAFGNISEVRTVQVLVPKNQTR